MYKGFTKHWFEIFLHKISGQSIDLWIENLNNFKEIVSNHLGQPTHPIEREYYDQPEEGQYIIHFQPNYIGELLDSLMSL